MSGPEGPALLRRLPKLRYRPASSPIAMLADCDEFPDLRDDLHFLAEVLQPQFEKCDIEALHQAAAFYQKYRIENRPADGSQPP